jgi:hypothetical protein
VEWKKITKEECQKLIESMPRRIAAREVTQSARIMEIQTYLLRQIQCWGESICHFTDFQIFVEFSFGSYQ